jgi:hypothetical protein
MARSGNKSRGRSTRARDDGKLQWIGQWRLPDTVGHYIDVYQAPEEDGLLGFVAWKVSTGGRQEPLLVTQAQLDAATLFVLGGTPDRPRYEGAVSHLPSGEASARTPLGASVHKPQSEEEIEARTSDLFSRLYRNPTSQRGSR